MKLSLGTSVCPELEKLEFELVIFNLDKNVSHFAAQDHCLLILVNDLLSLKITSLASFSSGIN